MEKDKERLFNHPVTASILSRNDIMEAAGIMLYADKNLILWTRLLYSLCILLIPLFFIIFAT